MATSNRPRTRRSALLAFVCVLQGAGGAIAGDYQYLDRSDKIYPGAGNAAAHNIAVQTINPWPPYVGNDRINVDGSRIDLGYLRYRANRSIHPHGLGTTDMRFNGYDQGGDQSAPSDAGPGGAASPGGDPVSGR
jgi:hypothetical protein